MKYDNIKVAHAGPLARVVLNRPDRRNAMSLALLGELQGALADCGADSQIDAVVIEGAGPVFSAGHDLTEMLDRDADFYTSLFAACTEAMLTIQSIPQPVVAKVHGVATAAGCQLVAACDLAVAADNAQFATPGVKIGLFCSTPMVPLTRAIGRKRALEMLFTGEPIDATTARSWGLVNRVAPVDELEAATVQLVEQIGTYSRDVIAIGKRAFYRQVNAAETRAYEITEPIMSGNARHHDAQEGMTAFLEKRTPQWGDH